MTHDNVSSVLAIVISTLHGELVVSFVSAP